MAPTALRSPISWVRSVTVVSMMFMMPIPPTISEMPAMPPRKMVRVAETSVAAARVASWLVTVKSSASSTVSCLSRINTVTSLTT